ncbi:hypothetical protein AMK05_CH03718 [Rhizobium sp. N324]|nr:hypothetical protein AMK05_CH03718 [Rhizobium sp. N324]
MTPWKRKEVIGDCTLYLGDSREIIPLIGNVTAVLSDPPYGIAFVHGGNDNTGIGSGRYATKFAKVAIEGDDAPFDPSHLLSVADEFILWGGNHFADKLPASSRWLIWDKRAASGHSNDFADCEIAWTNIKGVARVFRHHWDGMMKASERGQPRVHPTQKPIALMSWCLSFVAGGGHCHGSLYGLWIDRRRLRPAGTPFRRDGNRRRLFRNSVRSNSRRISAIGHLRMHPARNPRGPATSPNFAIRGR